MSLRASRACLLLGVLMLAAALGLLLHNKFEDSRAADASQTVLQELREQIAPAAPAPAVPAQQLPETEQALLPVQAEEPAAADTQASVHTVCVDGLNYLGYLSIPSLGLCLPVVEQMSESNLRIAPCCYSGSLEGGDLVIAGHNYQAHFSALHTLRPGDAVVFTAADGTEVSFLVDCMESLEPWQTAEMTAGDWPLTLFTCNVSASARVTVRCVLNEPAVQRGT